MLQDLILTYVWFSKHSSFGIIILEGIPFFDCWILYLLCNNQIISMHIYQSLVVRLNWLTACTCPNKTPIVTFLSDYNKHASTDHLKSPLYVLQYAHWTSDLGIHFSLALSLDAESHAKIHHRSPLDRDTYVYESAPTTTSQNELTCY